MVIESHVHHFHTNISENELILEIDKMNNNQDINGILIQLPLPKHINEEKVLNEISILKDVDGFGATNIEILQIELLILPKELLLGVWKMH